MRYQPSFTTGESAGLNQLALEIPELDIHHHLTPAHISEQFRVELARVRREEINRGQTLVGPQRDELRFIVNGRDLGLYGSRGQARTAIMAVKLAEVTWMTRMIGEPPVLLLDEFVAELDVHRRAYLLQHIEQVHQSLLTTTEPDMFTAGFLTSATVWKVHQGQILKPDSATS